MLEGESLALEVELPARAGVERLELRCAASAALRPAWAADRRRRPTRVAIEMRAERWGAARLGTARLSVGRTPAACGRSRRPSAVSTWCACIRGPSSCEAIVEPVLTASFTGAQISRAAGDGSELAGVRPFAPGDRVRRINWRATARRGTPHVTERLADRNADVVLFLDTFADVRSAIAAARWTRRCAPRRRVAHAHLERGDRVGVVGFGGMLQWLAPGLGARQRYRIVEALIESEIVFSYAWKDVSVLPQGALPPRALVIALTPLDRRACDRRAARPPRARLRPRGHRRVARAAPRAAAGRGRRARARLWRLQRAALRSRFEDAGVAVSTWLPRPRDSSRALRRWTQFRRYATRARSA